MFWFSWLIYYKNRCFRSTSWIFKVKCCFWLCQDFSSLWSAVRALPDRKSWVCARMCVYVSSRAFSVSAQTTRAVETGKVTFLSNHHWNPALPGIVCTCSGMDSQPGQVDESGLWAYMCVWVHDHWSSTKAKEQVPLLERKLKWLSSQVRRCLLYKINRILKL